MFSYGSRTMKKTLIAIILAILFLINIVAAAFIFTDIQALQFPETTIKINVVELNSDELIIHHDLKIYNPNSFEMILQDFQIVTTTPSGNEVTRINLSGGAIPGKSNRSYSANDHIILKENLSGDLTSTVTGTVGINFLGIIKKTIPLEVTVITSLQDILENISVPIITVRTEFGTITRKDINLTAQIDITNPNSFDMFVDDILLNVTTETGRPVGNFSISGSLIPADQSVTLNGSGTVLLEALNAKKLHMVLTTEAGVNLAGMNKTLPISTTIDVGIPNFASFIPPSPPLELAISIDFVKTKGGLGGNMTLEVINPTKIPLIARDLVVNYYRVKKYQKTLIAVGPLGTGELVPESTTLFKGYIFLPYSKLLNFSKGNLFPDMVFAQLRANISLSGVNQSLPIAIGSYVDIKLFRPNN
jgi:LEA14-like dessication related protein